MRAPAPAERPLLSVVVVSYDCRELLTACLDSLARQREELPFETLVVDNASNDGTAELVRERNPWVRLRRSEENLGFARANNLALEETRGEFVLLLNPDTVVPAGALRAAVEELRARPDVGMLGCKLVQPDGSLDHACKRGFPTPLSALCYFTGVSRLAPRSRLLSGYTAGHVDPDSTAYVDAVNGAFMLARREAVDAVGPLDESFWMYGEDLDWCRRFWNSGWAVLYWPGVSVTHVKGGCSGRRRNLPTNYAFHRAMWLFHRKHARGAGRLLTPVVWTGIHAKLLLSLRPRFA